MRYRLRTLLIAVAVAPLPLYLLWLPTTVGGRYVRAVNTGSYREADQLCVDDDNRFPGDWVRHKTFHPSAEMLPLTWNDFCRGERRLSVAINYGDGDGLIGCGVECCATARGVKVGMFMP